MRIALKGQPPINGRLCAHAAGAAVASLGKMIVRVNSSGVANQVLDAPRVMAALSNVLSRGFATTPATFKRLAADLETIASKVISEADRVGLEEMEFLFRRLARDPGIDNGMLGSLYELTATVKVIEELGADAKPHLLLDYWIKTVNGATDLDIFDATARIAYEAKTSAAAMMGKAARNATTGFDAQPGSAFFRKLQKYLAGNAEKMIIVSADPRALDTAYEITDSAVTAGLINAAGRDKLRAVIELRQVAIVYTKQ